MQCDTCVGGTRALLGRLLRPHLVLAPVVGSVENDGPGRILAIGASSGWEAFGHCLFPSVLHAVRAFTSIVKPSTSSCPSTISCAIHVLTTTYIRRIKGHLCWPYKSTDKCSTLSLGRVGNIKQRQATNVGKRCSAHLPKRFCRVPCALCIRALNASARPRREQQPVCLTPAQCCAVLVCFG